MEKKKYYEVPGQGKGKKILFANVPADGHFNPLTGLATHLKSIGYDVRWYSSNTYAPKIDRLGIPHYPFVRALDISSGTVDEVFPERERYKGQVSKLNFDLINVFIERSPEYFEDMKDIYQTFPFDLVIADVCFGALPLVREKMNIPVIAVGIVPLSATSRDLGPAGLGLTPAAGFMGRRKQDLQRFIADHIIFRRSNKAFRKLFKDYGIEPEGSNVFDALTRKSNLLLQSGTPGFEYRRSDLGSNIRFLGPLLPHQPTQQQPRWSDARLRHFDKVILVTQGTVEKDPEKIIVPTLEAFRNTEHLVIATTGGSKTAELQARFNAANIIIEDFIPFDDIMPHAHVYVTNGGYGGVLLGIQHQLPLVVGGIHEGKLEINARVGYFKLGINMKTENPTPEQVRQSVEAVLADGTYRQNVQALAREFDRYHPQRLCAGYVAELLQATDRSFGSYPAVHPDLQLAN